MYKILRNCLFLFPPEPVHGFSMGALRLLCSICLTRKLVIKLFTPKTQAGYSLYNINFPNKVGLAAGFDKNAEYLRELECLGFGFVEIGTVTPLPQPGNDKPRVFRLIKDRALINRMGFNNKGVKIVAEKLKDWKAKYELKKARYDKPRMIIGGNIGKNKVTPNEEAWKDYEICFRELHPYVDYFVVNVSSPNTPGLRELQEKDSLRKILSHLQTINAAQTYPKPLLLKIAPDLTIEQTNDVIDLALEIKLDGLVATNTTISREGLNPDSETKSRETGGLSGKPLQQKSTATIKYIAERTKGKIPIMASGGIFNGEDAAEKLNAGASLVQVWTGFIYEGPAIAKKICNTLNKQ
ncbi:MAG: quinone-dependent dihydroorotate dehydrogenase [Chitinophagaceae bacterium]|nr:quinone-dependent dihydroorotate dehydrogenase [Chitinophagaceae bacterium]